MVTNPALESFVVLFKTRTFNPGGRFYTVTVQNGTDEGGGPHGHTDLCGVVLPSTGTKSGIRYFTVCPIKL